MGRFLDKLEAKSDFVGTMDSMGGSQLAEVLAEAGFDLAVLDTMFCAFDWDAVFNWSRACLNRGMDPLIRLPSHPWASGSDSHLPSQVGRAFGIGLNGVVVSLNTPQEVEELLEVSQTWHKNLHLHPFKRDSYQDYARKTAATNVLMPMIESKQGIDSMQKILELEGLRVIWLGMSDISRVLGHPFDYEAPAVWKFLDETVRVAAANGVAVCANVGYEASREVPTLQARMAEMSRRGIKGIMLQNTGYMVQWLYRTVLSKDLK